MADGGRNLLDDAENNASLIAKMMAGMFNEDELLQNTARCRPPSSLVVPRTGGVD